MQKITIEPVTRIEGHAKVTIHLNGKGKVDKAYQEVNENSNYIIRGGSDKAADILDHAAVPTGKFDGEN